MNAPRNPSAEGAALGSLSVLTGTSEVEQAQAFRDRIRKPLDEAVLIINEARAKGMIISFSIGAPDAFGRQSLTSLEIMKKLC